MHDTLDPVLLQKQPEELNVLQRMRNFFGHGTVIRKVDKPLRIGVLGASQVTLRGSTV